MARMHSRKKGTAGSSRPYRSEPPAWVDYKKDELETLVVKLAKEGQSTSMIGVTLRDTHGVPNTKLVTGKKIDKILNSSDIERGLPEDLMNLIRRAVVIDKHLKANPKDMTSKRGLQLTESKIRRLMKYYKNNKRLPEDWSYNIKTAKLLVK